MARSVVAAHVIRSPSERNSLRSFRPQRSEARQSIRLRAAWEAKDRRGERHANDLEAFWAIGKRSIAGTYISVSKTHLQKYLWSLSFVRTCGRLRI
jgi:hypothetical protein